MNSVIKFNFYGLHLQEPMTLLFNGILTAFCIYAFFQLKLSKNKAIFYWRNFFLLLGISTFTGIFGHIFFYYLGFPGKYLSWMFAAAANVYAGIGMLRFGNFENRKMNTEWIAVSKSLILVILAIVLNKFIFVAIDPILTYIFYTGIFGYVLKRRGVPEMKWMILGVVVLLPSAFVFILKINIHRFFNKEDVSHVFMLFTLICFYTAISRWKKASLHVWEGK